MKTKELREKSSEELRNLLRSSQDDLEDLRFKHKGGKLANFRELRSLRRTIAKILTLLREQAR